MGRLEPASWYDDYYRANPEPGGMTEIHEEAAKAILRAQPPAVFDLGCGPGWFHEVLRRHGYEGIYTGWDFSAESIRQARLRCPLDVSSYFSVRDLTECTPDFYPQEMVVALEVLEHLEDDVATMKRFAAPGRRVLVSVPCYDSDSHVRFFKPSDDLGKRYGIKGEQWEVNRQLYLLGRFR